MTEFTQSMLLCLQIPLLQSRISKPIDNTLSLHGIGFTEFQVMYYLSQAQDLTLRRIELANAIGLSASGVTRLLLPMEKNRLVTKERNARDARVSLVKLTKTGIKILEDAMHSFSEITESLVQGLDKKEISQLLKLIFKL